MPSPAVIPVQNGTAHAYTVPTDAPEADGTFSWQSTTLILVELEADGVQGLGYTYSHQATAPLIRELLTLAVIGKNAFDTPTIFDHVRWLERNYGQGGIAATALSPSILPCGT
jgi:hypothetical protein